MLQVYYRKVIATAFYAAHCLNLAVSNSCDLSPIRNSIETIVSVYNFFNGPKHQNIYVSELTRYCQLQKLKNLFKFVPRRLVNQCESVSVFSDLPHAIIQPF